MSIFRRLKIWIRTHLLAYCTKCHKGKLKHVGGVTVDWYECDHCGTWFL